MKNRLFRQNRAHWCSLLPAGVLLIASAGICFVVGLSPSARSNQYAVVTAPWDSRIRTAGLVSEAGGTIVDAGGMANVLIAHSDDPGFVPALYRAGAWLVLDPLQLHGCFRLQHATTPATGES